MSDDSERRVMVSGPRFDEFHRPVYAICEWVGMGLLYLSAGIWVLSLTIWGSAKAPIAVTAVHRVVSDAVAWIAPAPLYVQLLPIAFGTFLAGMFILVIGVSGWIPPGDRSEVSADD